MPTRKRTQIKRQIRAVVVVLSVGASAAFSAPASAAVSEPSECNVVEDALGTHVAGNVPKEQFSHIEFVGKNADEGSNPDPALLLLSELTTLLDQSSRTAPAIVDGRLQASCEVAFLLDGYSAETGAVGISEVRTTQSSRWLVQALDGNRGHRMMVVLEDATAPTTYSVGLELAPGVSVNDLGSGGAVFVNEKEEVTGTVLAPWAFDADGNELPITQTITSTSITITVDTATATAWPIIADPTYHDLNCTTSMVTTTGTASQYLNGSRCPVYSDITARGYYPQWIHHFEHWRVGKPDGDCSWIPERLDTWDPQDIIDVLISLGLSRTYPLAFGVIYDFHQACQGHDYCYDLGHSDRLNYSNVKKADCDNIMYDDMKYDCTKRKSHVRPLCKYIAEGAFAAVKTVGRF